MLRHSQCALLPSTRPGTRFTDGWAGGTFHTEISLLPWDLNQCPLGYEPRLHQLDHQGTHTHTHSLTHPLTNSHSLTLTHPLTNSHSLTHSLTHTHSHSLTHSLTHTHSLSHSLSQMEWLVYDELLSRARELFSLNVCSSLLRSVATHVQTSREMNCILCSVATKFVCGVTHCQQLFLKVMYHCMRYNSVSCLITIATRSHIHVRSINH